jgi:hypothetical protein
MRLERLFWVAVVIVLGSFLLYERSLKKDLEDSFIANHYYKPIIKDALKRYSNGQPKDVQKIKQMFFISHTFINKNPCIVFVPRPYTHHGYRTYCYLSYDNVTLVSMDKGDT